MTGHVAHPYWPDDDRTLVFRPEVGAEESPFWDPQGSLYYLDARHLDLDEDLQHRLQAWAEPAALDRTDVLVEAGRKLFEEVQRALPQAHLVWDYDD